MRLVLNMKLNKSTSIFIISFVILNILDIITTKLTLSRDVTSGIQEYNISLFILVKLIGVIIVVLLMFWCYKRDTKITIIGMIIIILMYIGIVINNTYWILS